MLTHQHGNQDNDSVQSKSSNTVKERIQCPMESGSNEELERYL